MLRRNARQLYTAPLLSAVGRRALWRSAAGPRRVSRGQALVEFVVIFPIIMLLVLGATDVSTLLNDHLSVVYATRTSARVGGILGTAPTADCAVIGALRAALVGDRYVTTQRIIIYKANAAGLPDGTNEDIYPGNANCQSDGTISPYATTVNWPPSVRNNNPLIEDSLGVEIDYTYTFQLNLLGFGQFSGVDHAVMPIEVVIGAPLPPSGVGS